MPYELELPKELRQHWKVKILDKELLYEEPHVTIISKGTRWRFGLRNREFLDDSPSPSSVPKELMEIIDSAHGELSRQWNLRFPRNPVHRREQGVE